MTWTLGGAPCMVGIQNKFRSFPNIFSCYSIVCRVKCFSFTRVTILKYNFETVVTWPHTRSKFRFPKLGGTGQDFWWSGFFQLNRQSTMTPPVTDGVIYTGKVSSSTGTTALSSSSEPSPRLQGWPDKLAVVARVFLESTINAFTSAS